MENATKALLIAAGIFFGLLILTLCVYIFSQVRDYFTQTEEEKLLAQITKFNSEYEKYASNDVRGNDLLSLINKIVDYNQRQADVDGIKYERMCITIKLYDENTKSKYQYNTTATAAKKINFLLPQVITNSNGDEKTLNDISNMLNNIKTQGTIEYSEKQLQKLATNISNLFAPYDQYEDESKQELARQKRNSIIAVILNKEETDIDDKIIDDVEKAALEYYQYQQFKRAHFDCTGTTYNQQTGRIVKLDFEFTGKIE